MYCTLAEYVRNRCCQLLQAYRPSIGCHRTCYSHDSIGLLCAVAATGDDEAKTEPRGAHLVSWLRRQRWQWKPVAHASPEDITRNDEPRSSETSVMTTFGSTDNSDHSTAGAATQERRKRRDVHGYGTVPTQILSGSTVKRLVTSNDGMAHRLRGIQQRLLIDRLLQLQHSRIPQKRLTPKSDLQIIIPLSTIIRQLAVNDGVGSWWLVNGGATVPINNERPQSPIIVTDKRASHRRRASKSDIGDFSGQLNENALKMRRDRPPIDPMLLMVGIGRK